MTVSLLPPSNFLASGSNWAVRGMAWDSSRNRPVLLVAVVDGADQVLGFAMPRLRLPDVLPLGDRDSTFAGILEDPPHTDFHAFGIVDDGKRLCPLQMVRESSFGSEQLIDVAAVTPGASLVQRLDSAGQLRGLTLQVVALGRTPSRYTLTWRIISRRNGKDVLLGTGKIDASKLHDWQWVWLPMTSVADTLSDPVELSLQGDIGENVVNPLYLPVFKRLPESDDPPLQVNASPRDDGGVAKLRLYYAE
jgi:hypothetical protein